MLPFVSYNSTRIVFFIFPKICVNPNVLGFGPINRLVKNSSNKQTNKQKTLLITCVLILSSPRDKGPKAQRVRCLPKVTWQVEDGAMLIPRAQMRKLRQGGGVKLLPVHVSVSEGSSCLPSVPWARPTPSQKWSCPEKAPCPHLLWKDLSEGTYQQPRGDMWYPHWTLLATGRAEWGALPKKNLPQEGLSPETLGAVGAIHRQAKQRCPGAGGWLEPGVYRPLLWGLKD